MAAVIPVAMTLRISKGERARVQALYAPGHPLPGAALRSVVVEFAPGHTYRTLLTTQADSGVIIRPAPAAAEEAPAVPLVEAAR